MNRQGHYKNQSSLNKSNDSSLFLKINASKMKTTNESKIGIGYTSWSSKFHSRQPSKNLTVNSVIYNPDIKDFLINKDEEEQSQFINDLDEVQKLKRLFLYYSGNDRKLRSLKFISLLIDAKILDRTLDERGADILFFSASKAKKVIDFNSFCEVIVKISEMKFPEEFMKNPSSALEKLINSYFLPLLNTIVHKGFKELDNNNPYGSGSTSRRIQNWESLITKFNSESNKAIVDRHFYFLFQIYSNLFTWEFLTISNYQKSNLSEKAFYCFCKDLELCPNLVSLLKLNEIYQNVVINTKCIVKTLNVLQEENSNYANRGSCFTLYHFIISIYLIAACNEMSLNLKDELEDDEQLANEYDSKGFDMVLRGLYKSNMIKDYIPNIHAQIQPFNGSPKARECNRFTFQEKEDQIYSSFHNQLEIDNEFFEKNKDIFLVIYKYYSSIFCDTNFSIFMSHDGFIKFLKDIGLLSVNSLKEKFPEFSNKAFELPDSNQQKPKMLKEVLNKTTFKKKLRAGWLSFPMINLLFSKFSSEYKTLVPGVYNKTNKSSNSNEANRRINFYSFLKILICISNKIFNSQYNSLSIESNSIMSIDKLIDANSKTLQKYFEYFIENYLKPLYNETRVFIEKESFDFLVLNKVYSDENIDRLFAKLKPPLFKLFQLYSNGRTEITFEEVSRLCADFEIFPDLISRTKFIHLFISFVDDFDNTKVIPGDSGMCIGFERFIGFLIFIAIGSRIGAADDIDMFKKLLYFLQRMIQSNGMKKIILNTSSSKIANEITSVYNSYRYYIESDSNLKKRKSFRDLIIKK